MGPENCGVPVDAVSGYQKFEGPCPADWCKRGYAIVNIDARGVGDSEGNMVFWGEEVIASSVICIMLENLRLKIILWIRKRKICTIQLAGHPIRLGAMVPSLLLVTRGWLSRSSTLPPATVSPH